MGDRWVDCRAHPDIPSHHLLSLTSHLTVVTGLGADSDAASLRMDNCIISCHCGSWGHYRPRHIEFLLQAHQVLREFLLEESLSIDFENLAALVTNSTNGSNKVTAFTLLGDNWSFGTRRSPTLQSEEARCGTLRVRSTVLGCCLHSVIHARLLMFFLGAYARSHRLKHRLWRCNFCLNVHFGLFHGQVCPSFGFY